LNVEGRESAERIFQTLAEGGKVVMPLQKTFWSPAFGVVTDRFGTPWEINCGNAD
jgi:PhnB protein